MTVTESVQSGFRDPASLTRALQFLLATLLVADIANWLSDLAQYQLLQSNHTEAEATANDARQNIVGGVYLAIFVVTTITFGVWIHRANKNARALGAVGMEFTAAWSVGWYFIPIYNLWKPYQAMREIWNASKSPTQWSSEPTDPILRWWWFGWVTSIILGQLNFRLSMGGHNVTPLSAVFVVGLISDCLSISLALVLITRLSQMQIVQHAGK